MRGPYKWRRIQSGSTGLCSTGLRSTGPRSTSLITVILLLALLPASWLMQSWMLEPNTLLASINQASFNQAEAVYIPAIVAHSPQATPTPRSVPTIFATASPTPRTTETATAVPTPTSTAIASAFLRFEGTSSQGQTVVVETHIDLSAVTRFEMNAQIICTNTMGTVEISVSDQLGYEIQGNRFQIRIPSAGGNEHIVRGTLDSDGSRMNGSWSIWLDGAEPIQPCSNKGEWSATRQTP